MQPNDRLQERHLRVLRAMLLLRGGTAELDRLPQLEGLQRLVAAAKSLEGVVCDYDHLRQLAGQAGMREALQGEVRLRHSQAQAAGAGAAGAAAAAAGGAGSGMAQRIVQGAQQAAGAVAAAAVPRPAFAA